MYFRNTLILHLKALIESLALQMHDTFVFGFTEQEHEKNLATSWSKHSKKGLYSAKANCNSSAKRSASLGTPGHPKAYGPTTGKSWELTELVNRPSYSVTTSFVTQAASIHILATITGLLPELSRKEVAYSWGAEHDRAFKAVQQEVSSPLAYWDTSTLVKVL